MNNLLIVIILIAIALLFFLNTNKPRSIEGYDYYHYYDGFAYPFIFNIGTGYIPSYDLRGDIPVF